MMAHRSYSQEQTLHRPSQPLPPTHAFSSQPIAPHGNTSHMSSSSSVVSPVLGVKSCSTPSPSPPAGPRSDRSESPSNRGGVDGDIPLKDILERYADNDDVLRLVLTAKIQEDKRRAEHDRLLAEQTKLQCQRTEFEIQQKRQVSPKAMQPSSYTPTKEVGPYSPPISSIPADGDTPNTFSAPRSAHASAPRSNGYYSTHSSNGGSAPTTTLSAMTVKPPSTQSSFTNCITYSPADITQMPPLPLPPPHSMVNASGTPAAINPSQTHSTSPMATNTQLGGTSTVDRGVRRSYSYVDSSSARRSSRYVPTSADSNGSSLSAKKRQHEEVMRTVRERVLSKRNRNNAHNGSLPTLDTSPSTVSPPVPSGAPRSASGFDVREHRSMTLPPLQLPKAGGPRSADVITSYKDHPFA